MIVHDPGKNPRGIRGRRYRLPYPLSECVRRFSGANRNSGLFTKAVPSGHYPPKSILPLTPGGAEGRSEEQRLNSSHVRISYAVFCLKKKNRAADAGGVGVVSV